MQIYFVRHGKTEWNLAGRFQGAHGDSPLLPASFDDIAKLAAYLAPLNFSGFYSSPLKRALITATKLRDALMSPLPVATDERLIEFDLGQMEGLCFKVATARFPQQMATLWTQPEHYDGHQIGGEDYLDVLARGRSFAQDLAHQYLQKTAKVLVVSHGACLNAIMGGLLGYPLAAIRQNGGLSNTSLSILETTDQGQSYQLVAWNETSYLGRKMMGSDSL